MQRCVIVSAVPIEDFRALLRADDEIIACDAGYLNCARAGVQPNMILGDFDSAAQPMRDDCIVLPHEKDDTDTHYAAKLAVARGYKEVLLLGALGGKRLEHTLANLQTGLWLAEQGVAVSLRDAYSRVSFVLPGVPRQYAQEDYLYFSVFPMRGCAHGVVIDGAAYPVVDGTLESNFPIGVSNEFCADVVNVSVQEGALVVVESMAD